MTGKELKAKRMERGMTQTAMAAVLEVTVDCVRKWEQGARPISKITAAGIIHKLECPTREE
jgi:DNA-binding transcriptional regulator YiaG